LKNANRFICQSLNEFSLYPYACAGAPLNDNKRNKAAKSHSITGATVNVNSCVALAQTLCKSTFVVTAPLSPLQRFGTIEAVANSIELRPYFLRQ
jgi:hypothetical protein